MMRYKKRIEFSQIVMNKFDSDPFMNEMAKKNPLVKAGLNPIPGRDWRRQVKLYGASSYLANFNLK